MQKRRGDIPCAKADWQQPWRDIAGRAEPNFFAALRPTCAGRDTTHEGGVDVRSRPDSRRMKRLRREFFEQGKRLDAAGDPAADCWLCRQRIDYNVEPHTTPDSHNLDHYHPFSTHPELLEDVTNWRHSHMLCNLSRGNRSPSPGLGESVGEWW